MLWRRQARGAVTSTELTRRAAPAFARVELAPSAPPTTPAGITLVVRTPRGVAAELTGLDATTAVTLMVPLVRTVLARRR